MADIPDIALECDSKVEDCDLQKSSDDPYVYPEVSGASLHWLGFIGILNASVPIIYWYFSDDYAGEYGEYRASPTSAKTTIISREKDPKSRRHEYKPKYNDDDDDRNYEEKDGYCTYSYYRCDPYREKERDEGDYEERKRGNIDYGIWLGMGIAHASIWGFQSLLYFFSFFGTWINKLLVIYFEQILSNLNYIMYLFGFILLFLDATYANDLQGYLELAGYTTLFAIVFYILEMRLGVRAIQRLDRTYPYDDKWLIPSIFYRWGWATHTMRPKPKQRDSKLDSTDDLESIKNNQGGNDNGEEENLPDPLDEFNFFTV